MAKYHWGNHLWSFIHTVSIIDNDDLSKNFKDSIFIINKLKMITEIIPCATCENEYRNSLETISSINLYKPKAVFYWTVDLHNHVNRKLGKAELSYSQAEKLWCI